MKEQNPVSPEMKIAAELKTHFVDPNIRETERPIHWHVQEVLTQKEWNDKFEQELTELLNKYGKDEECNCPDYVLASTMLDAMKLVKTFNQRNEARKIQCKKES